MKKKKKKKKKEKRKKIEREESVRLEEMESQPTQLSWGRKDK